MTPSTAKLPFTIRAYRAADFQRLWQIDQLCFPPGIAYTQMDLTGFITRRNAITLVAELEPGGEVAPAERDRRLCRGPTQPQSRTYSHA